MISPDIKDLMRNMDSRYTLVITAAKRARQLTGGAEPLTRFRSDKPVTLAIHEIAEGKVEYFRDVQSLSDYEGPDAQGRGSAAAYASVFYDDSDGGDAPPYMDRDERPYMDDGDGQPFMDGDAGIGGAGGDMDDDDDMDTGDDMDADGDDDAGADSDIDIDEGDDGDGDGDGGLSDI